MQLVLKLNRLICEEFGLSVYFTNHGEGEKLFSLVKEEYKFALGFVVFYCSCLSKVFPSDASIIQDCFLKQ